MSITSVSCGLVCVNNSENVNIYNCANKGNVEGIDSYGIANILESAHNVVSMGNRIEHPFWERVTETPTLYFVLDETCIKCKDDHVMTKKEDGKYYTVETEERVDLLLNEESIEAGYGKEWNMNLELGDLPKATVTIHIGSPLNVDVNITKGTRLGDSAIPDEFWDYHAFSDGTCENEITKQFVVGSNMSIELYRKITIKNSAQINVEREVMYISNGSSLCDEGSVCGGIINTICEVIDQYHVIEKPTSTSKWLLKEYKTNSIINHDAELYVCHKVETSNIIETFWMIGLGSKLNEGVIYGDDELLGDIFNQYHVRNGEETIFSSTRVRHDMNVTLFHIVECRGSDVNGTWEVLSDNMTVSGLIEDKTGLKPDEYVVGDRDTNKLLEPNTIIDKDLNAIMLTNAYSIEIELYQEEELVNETTIADNLSDELGIDREDLIIIIETNDNGNITRITVIVKDEDTATSIVSTIQENCIEH